LVLPDTFLFGSEADIPIPLEKYHGNLSGEKIRENTLFWTDTNSVNHCRSYNYDENGNIDNLCEKIL